ncbi:MAG TPA: hypothetical protein VNP94_02040 [Actinomycetota bacterium]|nr:hypothetical protein [Actinomycetota bacterium]
MDGADPGRRAVGGRARARPTSAVLALAAAALVVLAPGAAFARAEVGPTVGGWGRLSEDGARLTLHLWASSPEGWEALHLLTAALGPGGVEQIAFDIEDNLLTVSGRPMVVGTGAAVEGRRVRVEAADVVVTTGGARIELTLRARVLAGLEGGAPLRLGAEDDRGRRASVERALAVAGARPSPVGWATVAGAAFGALLVGVLLGGAVSARHHPRRVSVYAAVQRRIERERAGGGRPGAGTR